MFFLIRHTKKKAASMERMDEKARAEYVSEMGYNGPRIGNGDVV